MFRKSDKYLYWAEKIVIVFHVLAILAIIISSILLFYNKLILPGILCIIGGFIGGMISWVFSFLFLSYLWDVKKIRNRLYDENDVMLNRFFDD